MQSNRIPWLSRAVLVERHELPALLGGFLYFFCLLCSYYILRPVRDEMGVRGGVENLHWLFTATFFAMLVAVPIFAALASRLTRARLIPVSYGFFITCLFAFWLWLRTGVALDWGARTFFVWLSVFNLFVVSVFWSFMADLFEARQAARLFGAIAAGGSIGAILGPAITGLLVRHIGPAALLPIAAGVLALTLPCIRGLNRWSQRSCSAGGGSHTRERPMGGALFEGVQAVARSPYLLGICAFIWLYTTLATFLYFAQAQIVGQAFADSATRTAMFASIDFLTNALTVGVQLFVTARLVQWFGLGRALALVPVMVAAGFLVLAAAPGLIVLMIFQVLRRTGNYALARPGREMLFTVVPRMEKYKSKNFIDTVVYRGGDAIAGWLFAGLTTLGLGLTGISLAAVPLALLWAAIGYRLGHAQRTRARQAHAELKNERAACASAP